ncbi:MAG: hypothetical protein U1E34_05760 [Amaricoccus sp.]
MQPSRPSPLQNRCAPDGSLQAVPVRGLFLGNRGGRLHRDDGTLGPARWRSRAWICCRLAFRDRHRPVMGPGYTEIFFLDEATALAAGHRPCYECRRAEARAFATAWGRAQGVPPPAAPEIDRILHAERLGPRIPVPAASVPPGAIFAHAGAWQLRTAAGMRPWSFAGYGAEAPLPVARVTCLTPPATCAALAAGYAPHLHPSVRT